MLLHFIGACLRFRSQSLVNLIARINSFLQYLFYVTSYMESVRIKDGGRWRQNPSIVCIQKNTNVVEERRPRPYSSFQLDTPFYIRLDGTNSTRLGNTKLVSQLDYLVGCGHLCYYYYLWDNPSSMFQQNSYHCTE